MPALFCHSCQRQFAVPANTGECPQCHGGFVEEVAQPAGMDPFAGGGGGGGGQTFTRTFALPGGRGSVQILSSTGGGLPGLGGGVGGGMPGMVGADPFVQGVLEAVMGGRFLNHGAPFMGVPMEMGPMPMGGMPLPGGGGAVEQEWLDRLMSNIMNEYQPASQATSQRAVRSLPSLAVRGKEAQGEPGVGHAVARAGEPCSVCHDEFAVGDQVVELPCAHGYHSECIMPWLETHNTCPVCRYELPVEDPSVEARRRHRTDAPGGSSRHVRQRQEQQQQQHHHHQQPPPQEEPQAGSRLSDLLSNISARWDSFRSSQDGAGAAAAAHQAPAAATGPSAGRGAAATAAAGRASATATTSASTSHLDTSSATGSGRAPPAHAGASNLRQRRDAAAAAAEQRLHHDGAPAAAAAPAAPLPPHPAAAAAVPAACPAPTFVAVPPHQPNAPEEQGSGDSLVAGAVAGGVLGALLGGALMLLGGGRRRDRT